MSVPSINSLVPDHVMQFEAYQPSPPVEELMRMFGCSRLISLNNNENPLGPPPAARAVIETFPPPRAARYPSADCNPLRTRLAAHLGIHPSQMLFGNGANELVSFAMNTFCEPGDNIVTADRTFAVYEWIARFSGVETKLAPLKDFSFDENEILRLVDRRTKLVFICNPNNPTGTWWSRDRLVSFMEKLAPNHIVVLDEAYCEFMTDPDFPDGISLLSRFPNLMVFRTFSKMYGLAGLRIGYLAASEQMIELIRKTCIVYPVNALAQEAALAAALDTGFVSDTRNMVREGKKILTSGCDSLGLTWLGGEANFIIIKLPFSDTLAYRLMMQEGVMIRTMTPFRFPNWIRVTISVKEEMEIFCNTLTRLVRSRRDQSPLARAYGGIV